MLKTFKISFLISLSMLLIASTQARALPHLTVDLDSGRVLSGKQAFDPWHPASLTKLMTAYVIFKAVEAGEIAADSPVRFSTNATRQPPSRIGYGRGTVLTMDNALKLLIIKSANDVSVALAESLSGSVQAFAGRMNSEARRLGMTGSRFVNPHGLHDQRQITTARDMGLLVRAIHLEFPQYRALFRTPSLMAPKKRKDGKTIQRVHFSYNLLLERFRGGDGFKTGFVCASGYNFIGAATRGGRRIAAIVLGRSDQTSRAVDAAKLITEGFQRPVDYGTPFSDFKPDGARANAPRNMRPILCTEQARANRYEPGAGQAVIDSPWLSPRAITQNPLLVSLGGADGPVSSALEPKKPRRIARPTFRSVPVAAQKPDEPAEAVTPPPIRGSLAGANQQLVPVPRFRPQS